MAQRLRAEVADLLSRDPDPSYRSIDALPYMNNFIREVLRLKTPAIHYSREAIEEVVIQGVKIPKGTTLLGSPAVLHRNPKIWGDDCDEFRPDRWDKLEGLAADPWAFAAFSQGPRVCIGKMLTMMEFKLVLLEIVSKFEFEALGDVGGNIELVNPSPLLRPKGGLKVRVKWLGG